MDMRTYLHSVTPDERLRLANELGTSVNYFFQIAGGHRKASFTLAKRLEKATNGVLRKESLRPDIFSND